MASDRYSIGTLADMARIPEEARGRFLAELPAILDTIAPMVTLGDALDGVAKVSFNPVWVDDDKGMATVSVEVRDADGAQSFKGSATFKHGAPA